jgi:hypothetical protein
MMVDDGGGWRMMVDEENGEWDRDVDIVECSKGVLFFFLN